MPEQTLNTSRLSDLMYTPVTTVHQFMAKAEIQPILPEPAPNGCARQFNERQSVLMMLAADMVRSGMKFPLAARWACRIAEQLLLDPEAPRVHIEFRRNGALFCFTSDEAPEAAEAAGPARFRTTFDLDAYRAAIRAAMADA